MYCCKSVRLHFNEVFLFSDEDVLDTWFSSGIFPFSVHGWPAEVINNFSHLTNVDKI